jgi:hypothetical protein
MTLQAKLDEMRKQAEAGRPAEVSEVMHRATADLLASGIMDGVLQTGQPAPDFELADYDGQTVSSSALLNQGPLVVTFYRGVW